MRERSPQPAPDRRTPPVTGQVHDRLTEAAALAEEAKRLEALAGEAPPSPASSTEIPSGWREQARARADEIRALRAAASEVAQAALDACDRVLDALRRQRDEIVRGAAPDDERDTA